MNNIFVHLENFLMLLATFLCAYYGKKSIKHPPTKEKKSINHIRKRKKKRLKICNNVRYEKEYSFSGSPNNSPYIVGAVLVVIIVTAIITKL